MRKVNTNQIKEKKDEMSEQEPTLLQSDLADKLGLRPSTVKYYAQLGLIPYEQVGEGKNRRYLVSKVKPVVADIKRLQGKGYKILDIVKLYAEQGKLADYVDVSLLAFSNRPQVKNKKGVKQNG